MSYKISPKNALFLNFGGLGDEILFLPTLDSFKKLYPDCKISLLLEPRSKGINDLTDLIDDVVSYDVKSGNKIKSFFDLLFLIKKGRYDLIISSGSRQLISVLLFLSGIKYRVGYHAGFVSPLLLTQSVRLNKKQYAGSMYHDLLKGIGIKDPAPLPEIKVNSENVETAKNLLGDTTKPVILLHPGVSKLSIQKNIIKGWSKENWHELIKLLLESNKYTVVLSGGPDDEEIIQAITELIEKEITPQDQLINLYGKTKNIKELAAVIQISDLIVCVDSAPMHLGVGLNKKIVALFGPTDEKKLLPESPNFHPIKQENLPCRPCLWDKRLNSCSDKTCLEIPVSRVMQRINVTLK